MAISIHTAEIITKLKDRRETQDAFIRRVRGVGPSDGLPSRHGPGDKVERQADQTLENELNEKVKSSF